MARLGSPVIEIRNLIKSYGGLRPLRIKELAVGQGEVVSISGLDATAAEVFVNLVTGATLADEGDVILLGESTRTIETPDRWMALLDRVGVVTHRALLLDALTVAQNIALPLTFDLDPLPAPVREAVAGLGEEAGIDISHLDLQTGGLPPAVRLRTHLARALALSPAVLLLEHPTAVLPPEDAPEFGRLVSTVSQRRALAVVALSGDERFARGLGGLPLSWNGATGVMTSRGGRARWF